MQAGTLVLKELPNWRAASAAAVGQAPHRVAEDVEQVCLLLQIVRGEQPLQFELLQFGARSEQLPQLMAAAVLESKLAQAG